jgi:hypothetical protein
MANDHGEPTLGTFLFLGLGGVIGYLVLGPLGALIGTAIAFTLRQLSLTKLGNSIMREGASLLVLGVIVLIVLAAISAPGSCSSGGNPNREYRP